MANFQVFDAYGSVITIESSVFGSEHRQIVGASIIGALTTTPSGNQSVSGFVDVSGSVVGFQGGTRISSLVSTVPSSVIVGASIFGLAPVNITNTILTIAGVSSLVSTVPSSVIVGASIFGLAPVNITNTTVPIAGSVAAFQAGTQISSLVSTVPSSVIVGASVFGQLPAGTAPLGSVATLQGTNPWIITGSIQGAIIAPVSSWIQGTGDLRTVQGASVQVLAAQGANIFTYVTGLQVANLGPSSVIVTLAGGLGSILGYTIAPSGGGSNIYYPNGLKTGTNSAFTASISGVSSVLVSAQGFTSST